MKQYILAFIFAATCVPPLVGIVFALACCSPRAMQPAVGLDTDVPDYDRSTWGRWRDENRDCQDTRQEVLAAESTEPVTWDERGCKVLSGRWECPFTGETFTNPGVLDVDHMVPLREAHYSGGYSWSKEQRVLYFNSLDHPNHLRAVSRSANRSKGSRQPHEWLPTNTAFRCQYLRDWVTIKLTWSLEQDCDEAQKLNILLVEHCR